MFLTTISYPHPKSEESKCQRHWVRNPWSCSSNAEVGFELRAGWLPGCVLFPAAIKIGRKSPGPCRVGALCSLWFSSLLTETNRGPPLTCAPAAGVWELRLASPEGPGDNCLQCQGGCLGCRLGKGTLSHRNMESILLLMLLCPLLSKHLIY